MADIMQLIGELNLTYKAMIESLESVLQASHHKIMMWVVSDPKTLSAQN